MKIISPVMLFPVGLLWLVTACAPTSLQTAPHLIVDKEGYALSDEGARLSHEQFQTRIDTIMARVRRHIDEHATEDEPARVLVMVHGGLTDIASGLKYIDTMTDGGNLLKKDGQLQADVLPVFINWDSSLWSSLWDDLFLVRLGKRNPVTGVLTSPFMIAARFLDGIIWLPVNLVHHSDTVTMPFQSWNKEDRTFTENLRSGALTLVSLPPSVLTLPIVSGYGSGQVIDRLW